MNNVHRVKKYCSELDLDSLLEYDCINLLVSSTGSGKTQAALSLAAENQKVAFTAPFVSITSQLAMAFPNLEIMKGTKAQGKEAFAAADGRIVSFHSLPRLLEMKTLDLLIIDEIHYLPNYSFTKGMLNIFWSTLKELQAKHPKMKVVALTATPQFVRLYPHFNFNEIVVVPDIILAKPSRIRVQRTWKEELDSKSSYFFLYDSCKNGLAKSKRYDGIFIDSNSKEKTSAYHEILKGRMPDKPRIFTSTVLSTGISVLDKVDYVYTNWLSLLDIVQMSARPRLGEHELRVTRTIPWYVREKGEWDEPELLWTGNFQKDMELLNEWQNYFSYIVHKRGEQSLHDVLFELIWAPQKPLMEIGGEY